MSKPKIFVGDISLKQYCKDNNLGYSRICRKIREQKITPEEAIQQWLKYKEPYSRCYILMKDGTPLKKYCDENGIDYNNAIRRLNKYGCTPEESLYQSVASGGRAENRIKYRYKGTPIADLPNYNSIQKRIRRGETIRQAVESDSYIEKLFYKGEPVIKYCKDRKMYMNVWRRVRRLGWSVERALLTPVTKQNQIDALAISREKQKMKYRFI